jgi:hypothetical protein
MSVPRAWQRVFGLGQWDRILHSRAKHHSAASGGVTCSMAIRHETAICIQTGHIVWMHGPFPCGEWSDVRVAGDALIPSLDAIEVFVADKGCLDGN